MFKFYTQCELLVPSVSFRFFSLIISVHICVKPPYPKRNNKVIKQSESNDKILRNVSEQLVDRSRREKSDGGQSRSFDQSIATGFSRPTDPVDSP